MEKQEFFILVIILVLVIIRIVNFTFTDFFDNTHNIKTHPNINYYPCDKHPNNSNCTCHANMTQQIIYKDFPINYTTSSPYNYTCVNSSSPKPSVNLFNNP